jgi:nitrile hydratase
MRAETSDRPKLLRAVVKATGEEPAFKVGEAIKVQMRAPIGHYRVPLCIRGKQGSIEAVIRPVGIDNEEEGFGRNAGMKAHYYRIAIPLKELWPDYTGSPKDGLRIEVFETWLEGI